MTATTDPSGEMTSWMWLLGRSEPPPVQRLLTAGRLSAKLSGLDLLDIRLDGIEAVRRIGVRVRDDAWGTVPPTDQHVTIDRTGEGFEIALGARHQGKGVDFVWSGKIQGEGNGTLFCEMEGWALSECVYDRIGFVILHPLTIAGANFTAGKHGGSPVAGMLPTTIAPQVVSDGVEQPLFPAFDHLVIDHPDRLRLTFDFEGDLFEMEDQRNWTDGSFKTFSTPLAIPIPLILRSGEVLRQSLRFGSASRAGAGRAKARRRTPVCLTIGGLLDRTLPPIGIAGDSDGHQPTGDETALIRSMVPAHLRAEVRADKPGAAEAVRLASRSAAAFDVPLQLALVLDGEANDITEPIRALAPLLAASSIAALFLLPLGETVTPGAWVGQARNVLGPPLAARLGIGTRSDFVELNRRRPLALDDIALTFAISPQVHDSDEVTVIQSLEAQPDTVATIRSFAPSAPIHVGPITLRPRARQLPCDPSADIGVDPRQASLFAAAWLVASVKQLAEAGAASLTYFECTGRRGFVGRSPTEGHLSGPEMRAYPIFHAFAMLAGFSRARLVACASSDPATAQALAIQGERGFSAIVANLAPETQAIRLTDLPPGRYQARSITPDGWKPDSTSDRGPDGLELGPYAVAMLSIGS